MKIKVNVDLVSNTTERKEEKVLSQNNWKVIFLKENHRDTNMSIYFDLPAGHFAKKNSAASKI